MGQPLGRTESPVLSEAGSRLAFTRNGNGEQSIYTVLIFPEKILKHDLMVSSADPIQHPSPFTRWQHTCLHAARGNQLGHSLGTSQTDGELDRLSYDIQHELFPHFLNNDQGIWE
jgi:hypothetical protein